MYKKVTIKTCLNPIFYVLFLTACSSGERYNLSSQVMARVNGDEITVSQVSAELQKIKIQVSEQSQISKKILTGLIDRQLLVQESFKLNLDRMPEVQEAVASAKAQIYAQVYISKKLAKLAPPTEMEIKQFINESPQYFSQRKVFHTLDIKFENHSNALDLHWLEAEVNTLDTLLKVLHENGIPFQVVSNQFSTDGLPQVLLEKIKQVKVGNLLFVHDDDKVVVQSIALIEAFSLPPSQLEQIATRVLTEQHKKIFIEKEINRLKSLAKIEVVKAN